jgi:hypothetical protein
VDTVPDSLLRKSGSSGNRMRISGFVARNSDHYTTEAGRNHHITIANKFSENVNSVQIFWNDSNKLKFDSGRNKDYIKF